jgi:lactam utilization protein B
MPDAANAKHVDLNSDMGEAFGAYRMGDDGAILAYVTSANVACGFHGGDPEVMAATFTSAKERGVAVGAHPGFADLWGFGRRVIPHSTGEIERLVAYQVGAAQALAAYAGHRITYVKAHGALGNLTESDEGVASAVANAVHAVDPSLICLARERRPCTDLTSQRLGLGTSADRTLGTAACVSKNSVCQGCGADPMRAALNRPSSLCDPYRKPRHARRSGS